MDTEEVFREMIASGVQAPSGDNCQPWRFVIVHDSLHVFFIPGRDYSLYSWGHRASFLAQGALIENMVITASARGYGVDIKLFPDNKEEDLVAILELKNASIKKDILYDYIPLRTTNRKPYDKDSKISELQKKELLKTAEEVGGGKVVLEEKKREIAVFGKEVGTNEKVLFENKYLHKFFFDHINWSKREDKKKKIGFYIKTLEVKFFEILIFRLIRRWPILRVINKIGFSDFVAKENAKTYSSAAIIGGVVIKENTRENFVIAGRVFQRIWLKATKFGLSLQPCAGIPFLKQIVTFGGGQNISKKHSSIVNDAYGRISKIFGAEKQVLAMAFRIGLSEKPSAKTLRLDPNIRRGEKAGYDF